MQQKEHVGIQTMHGISSAWSAAWDDTRLAAWSFSDHHRRMLRSLEGNSLISLLCWTLVQHARPGREVLLAQPLAAAAHQDSTTLQGRVKGQGAGGLGQRLGGRGSAGRSCYMLLRQHSFADVGCHQAYCAEQSRPQEQHQATQRTSVRVLPHLRSLPPSPPSMIMLLRTGG